MPEVNSANAAEVLKIRETADRVLAQRHPEILLTVRGAIAEVLGREEAEVQPSSSLMNDLNAESLDFLDLLFRLESAFGIKIPRGGIQRATQGSLTEAEFQQNGVLTEAALERLRILMPEVDPGRLQTGLTAREIPTLFTPETFTRLVAWRIGELEAEKAAGS
ncbi:MAG TPA: phosphopantetheine-binding protein [Terriglobales bacterium]|nr:phosphopantetheine-binding protein [Terriglobales bacterium]